MKTKTVLGLKRAAETSLGIVLTWTDHKDFGGSAHAPYDGGFVSVMADPPEGQPHAAFVTNRDQRPLDIGGQTEENGNGWEDVVQMAMSLR